MDRRWLLVYERLVNTDTGYEVPIDEKIESTSFIAEILENMGFDVKRGRASHVATLGDPPYLTFIGHLDTVFKRGEPRIRPFRIEGGAVHGPGVADMKGGVVLALMTLEKLVEEGVSSLAVVFNVDEEIGSVESEVDHVEMAEKTRFCLSFETGRGVKKVIVGRKGIADMRLRSFGKSGHASTPDSGANAILELTSRVQELGVVKIGDLTATPTIISGGFKGNVIPDYADCFYDVRFSKDEELEALKDFVSKGLEDVKVEGARTECEISLRRPPMTPIGKALEVLESSGGEGIRVNGGGDASFYTQKGVPALDGLGIVGRNIHSPDEIAFLDSVEERLELVTAIIDSILNS